MPDGRVVRKTAQGEAMQTALPVRMIGTLAAVRVTCDGEAVLAGAITGDQWRKALRVADDRDLWAKQDPEDVLIAGDRPYVVPAGLSFFTAPRRINGS